MVYATYLFSNIFLTWGTHWTSSEFISAYSYLFQATLLRCQ